MSGQLPNQPPFPDPAAPPQAPAAGAIAPGMEALSDEGPLHFTARALAAQLQSVFPPNRFDFQILDGKLDKVQWARLTRRTPTVALGWAGVRPEQGTSRVFFGRSHWFVALVTSNANGPAGRLLGDRAGPGILSMVRAATIALNGFAIDPAETPWAAAGATEVGDVALLAADEFAGESFAAAGVECSVLYEEALPGALDTPNAFDALSVNWTFAAGAGNGGWTDLMQSQGTP